MESKTAYTPVTRPVSGLGGLWTVPRPPKLRPQPAIPGQAPRLPKPCLKYTPTTQATLVIKKIMNKFKIDCAGHPDRPLQLRRQAAAVVIQTAQAGPKQPRPCTIRRSGNFENSVITGLQTVQVAPIDRTDRPPTQAAQAPRSPIPRMICTNLWAEFQGAQAAKAAM